MVSQTIHGTYTETYDLNTAVGELSMLAIHTPQAPAVKKMFKGFFEQYKKYKVLGCNFNMVCASQQSLDPSQIGLEAGQVDPRDVLNPILFKACTGESINQLVDLIYNRRADVEASVTSPVTDPERFRSITQVYTNVQSAKDAYYQMLADDSWRKSHPQRGITVMGLKPMVHKVVTTQPFKWTGYQTGTSTKENILGEPMATASAMGPETTDQMKGFGGPMKTALVPDSLDANPTVFVSNGITEMPWLETTVEQHVSEVSDVSSPARSLKIGYGTINNIPRVYMGALILPPAILQRLFFRLQITWHVLFRDFRPAYELGPISPGHDSNGNPLYPIHDPDGMVNEQDGYTTYFNMYHNATPSKGVTNEFSSFTTTEGTEVETVMEKVQ